MRNHDGQEAHRRDSLEIIYQDKDLVVVNKPAGMLVHKSAMDRHETRFVLQMIRDQIGQRVFPVHRLDKPTAGGLLFPSGDPGKDQFWGSSGQPFSADPWPSGVGECGSGFQGTHCFG